MLNKYISLLNNRLSRDDLARLDGWRGFLSVIVMIAHANQIFIAPITGVDNNIFWGFGVLAHISVLGFFVISGIVISMSLYINVFKNNFELSFKQYFLSRVSRIYPPLFFSLFLCVLFLFVINGFNLLGSSHSFKLSEDLYVARDYFTFSVGDIFKTLFFERGGMVKVNGPLWSLVIEWWIYFLAFFFTGVFFSRTKYMKFLYFIFFLLILNKLIRIDGLIYLFIWLIGLVFFLINNQKKFARYVFLFSLIGLTYCNYLFDIINQRLDISHLPIVQFFVASFFYSIILFFPIRSIFNGISKYSYTIYITHYPIFLFLFSIFHSQVKASLILNLTLIFFSILLVLIISLNAYPYIENKTYFSNKISNIFSKVKIPELKNTKHNSK